MGVATRGPRDPAASGGPRERAAVVAALIAAALSVAGYVVAKAVRDALYLATFPVERLPYFVIATGALSAILVGTYTRLNARFGPHRVVPALALLTAASMPPLWLGVRAGSQAAIATLFAWTTISGTLLTSGFWAVLGERFDPRSARKLFGWMGVATTVGGLIGGFGASLFVRAIDAEGLLLVLGGSCVVLAIAMFRVGSAPRDRDEAEGPVARMREPRASGGLVAGVREVATTSYLRDIALLIALGTVAAGVADYMLKDVASKSLSGKRELAAFFSLFHGVVGAVTLAVQVLVARPLVHRRGVAAALAALPRWLVAGALGVAVIPGLWSVAVLRGGENAIRNSFHRAGYELLFVPLSPASKRVVKPILDTLLERLGDAVGAGLILLLVSVFHLSAARLALAVFVLAAMELVVIPRVRRGYVATLSSNLAARAVELDEVAEAVDDDATAREAVRSTLLDMRAEDLRRSMVQSELGKSLMRSLEIDAPSLVERAREATSTAPAQASPRPAARLFDDPVIQLAADLASEDTARAKAALERWDRRDKRPLAFIIALLGREDLHREATRVLARAGDRFAGTLADHLDDPDEPFDVRRRIPRALAACQAPKAVGALTRALRDGRFEVRYHAACALERIVAHAGKRPAEATVWAVVREEVKKSRAVFEAQRLLDDDDDDPLADAVGRRGAQSLRHVFRLLGLVLDPKPLALAYRAVVGDDRQFYGVGLEFLENVLPKDVKQALWPLIGDERRPPPERPSARTLDRVIEDLEASGAMSRKLPKRDEARGDD
jgi:ATP:ADP antiporter, AAA family